MFKCRKTQKTKVFYGIIFGVFRRGNKPSVLPREEKRAERQ